MCFFLLSLEEHLFYYLIEKQLLCSCFCLTTAGFPHNRENGKSPGIRYWSFTAMKSPGISTFWDLSRELSGKICSLDHPQRHSYAWMLNLVYQLFFARKRLNCSSTTAYVIRQMNDGISTGEYLLVPANIIR